LYGEEVLLNPTECKEFKILLNVCKLKKYRETDDFEDSGNEEESVPGSSPLPSAPKSPEANHASEQAAVDHEEVETRDAEEEEEEKDEGEGNCTLLLSDGSDADDDPVCQDEPPAKRPRTSSTTILIDSSDDEGHPNRSISLQAVTRSRFSEAIPVDDDDDDDECLVREASRRPSSCQVDQVDTRCPARVNELVSGSGIMMLADSESESEENVCDEETFDSAEDVPDCPIPAGIKPSVRLPSLLIFLSSMCSGL
jgi:hypothetical protein